MNMNLCLPINQLGYGIVGTNLAVEIRKIIKNVCIWPIGPIEGNDDHFNFLSGSVANAGIFDKYATSYKLFHADQLIMHPSRGKWMGSTFFELDKLTVREVCFLNSLDVIFSFGEWSKRTMIENGVNAKIVNVGVGVDKRFFYPREEQVKDKTVFINCGKWEKRKGHDILIEAFLSAFNEEDQVELWMMNSNVFLSEEESLKWTKLYKDHPLSNKVKIVKRVPSQKEVADVFARVDCGVFPSRAEGWNLECMELMAMGKNIIATNCTAHTEYCTSENSMLVEVPEKEPAIDNKWFHGNGNWHKIGEKEIGMFSEYMREFHKKKMEGKNLINVGGIISASEFSYEKTAKIICEYA